jgi:AraC-like DNA-binding protein
VTRLLPFFPTRKWRYRDPTPSLSATVRLICCRFVPECSDPSRHLVVLGLRSGLARSANAPAWFRGASDPRLSRALQAIHGETGKSWTVDKLAKLSNMSRATFARVFQGVLGDTPMRYLTDWRMTVARDLLRTQDIPLAEVAERVGYSSLYAFATAFRRHHGQPPGRWRQNGLAPAEVALAH